MFHLTCLAITLILTHITAYYVGKTNAFNEIAARKNAEAARIRERTAKIHEEINQLRGAK